MDTASFSENADALSDRLRARVEGDERRGGRSIDWMNTFIDTPPGPCVLGAVALGYMVARFARRPH